MKRPNPEFNAGAAQARKRIKAHINAKYGIPGTPGQYFDCDPKKIIAFIDAMSKRSAKRPGGQGRK